MRALAFLISLTLCSASAFANNLPAFTDGNYQKEVLDASKTKPVVVKFWAVWCPACRAYEPIFEAVAAKMGGQFVFGTADADETPLFKAAVGLNVLPTTVLFQDGKPARMKTGAMSETELMAFLSGQDPGDAADPAGGGGGASPEVVAQIQSAIQQGLAQGNVAITADAWKALKAGDRIFGFDAGGRHVIKILLVKKVGDELYVKITEPDKESAGGIYKYDHFMLTHQSWVVQGLIQKK